MSSRGDCGGLDWTLGVIGAVPGGKAAAFGGKALVEGGARAVGRLFWGNQRTLARHFRDHGADFGARSADEYADLAADALRTSQVERWPTKIDSDGVIRIYDPNTNTFGAFNPDGTAKTLFKPQRGSDYWDDQPGIAPIEIGQ